MKPKFIIAFLVLFLLSTISAFYFTNTKNIDALKTSGKVNIPVIVIDPGHGGIDGGAKANDGTLEKNINLDIASTINDIMKCLGFKTVMTRSTDISIHDDDAKSVRQKKVSDIRNRLKIIEDLDNCVFISIHQNHFQQEKYHGTQVFYSRNNLQSKELAQNVQTSVKNLLQPDNKREIKKSGTEYYLLYNTKVPAVMIECGFLSNSNESSRLKDSDYQKSIALSITNGIISYFLDVGVS